MAIRRCPYCKAIIDETQKYCNNCGTQLLFPEDEHVEEDIKGDKIVDEDFKDEDEPEKPLKSPEEEEGGKEEIDLEEILEGGADFPGEEQLEEEKEEERLAQETPAEEILKESEEPEEPEEEVQEQKEEFIEPEAEEMAQPPEIEEEEIQEPAAEKLEEEGREEEKEEEEGETGEVEEILTDSDTREEITRFIEALEKKQKKQELTEEEEKILAPLEEPGDLPPWADLGGETAPPEAVEAEEEVEEKPEEEGVGPGDTMEFEEEIMSGAEKAAPARETMGIPETAAKEESADFFEREEEEEEIPVPTIEEIMKETHEIEAPGFKEREIRLGFFGRIKAILFDLIFISVLWLGAGWIASRLMDAPLLKLIEASAVPLAIFYAILLAGYLFLFLFFLGETLGGRVASPRD
jgi:hypothetical protein